MDRNDSGSGITLVFGVRIVVAQSVSVDWKPFSAEEVEVLLETSGASNGQQTMALRKSLLAKYPELQ